MRFRHSPIVWIAAAGLLAACPAPLRAQLTLDVSRIRSYPVQVDGRLKIDSVAGLPQGPRAQMGTIHPPLETEEHAVNPLGTSRGPAVNVPIPMYSILAPATLRSFPTTPSLTGLQPPDPVLAVGPNHVVTTTNEGMRIHNPDGTTVSFVAWPNFFPATVDGVTAGTFSDPQILYDHYHDQWLLAMICYDIAGQVGRVWIVRSDGPDPNGGWNGFRLSMRVSDDPSSFQFLIDYPRLGMNDDTVYITGALFSYPSFQASGSRMLQISLNALEQASPAIVADTWTGFETDIVCPAVMRTPQAYYGNPSWNVGYLVQASDFDSDKIIVWRFASRWSAGATAFVDGYLQNVNYYYPPPAGYQVGGPSSPYIDTGDCRVAGVTFLNGIMETTQQVGYDPMDGSGVSSSIKTYRWDTTGIGEPALVRDLIIYSGGTDLYYPSATLTIDGDSLWAVAASSPSLSPSLMTLAWRTSGLDGSFALIKQGEDIYNRPPNRWGDYFGTALDPFDQRTVWVTGEYAKATNSWGVWVAETNYKPFTTMMVSNASGTPGGTTTLSATLKRSGTGTPVSGGTIKFTLDSYYVGAAVSDANGVATLLATIPAELNAGTHAIIGTFDRSTTLNGCAGAATLTIGSAPTSISVPNVTAQVGQPVLLAATLVQSSNSAGVAGKSLTFKVDGVAVPGSPATTDSTGKATVSYTPAEGSIGSHTISVAFAGDSGYNASTGSGTLTVGRGGTVLVVQNVSGSAGSTVTLRASLTRTGDNAPLSGKSITFTVGTAVLSPATTDASGVATKSYAIPSTTGAGAVIPVSASFGGDVNYTASSGSASLSVLMKATLTTSGASGNFGSSVVLKATLKNAVSGISGAAVRFKVDGTAVGTATTDATGVALLAHVLTEAVGTHVLSSEFDGDSWNAPAKGTNATLTVKPLATTLTVTNLIVPPGTATNLKATLKAGTVFLSGKPVDFSIDGVSAGTAMTDASGMALLPFTAGASEGSYTIAAKFSGDSMYGTSSGSGTLTVRKLDTTTTPTTTTGKPGQTVTLKATVKSGSTPIVGAQVDFRIDGVFLATGTTDLTGLATTTYRVPESAGTSKVIAAQYAGDASHNGSSGSSTLSIMQASTKVTGEALTKAAGSTVDLGAKLTRTTDNAVLAGRTLSFYDSTGTTLIGSGVTNASGRASISVVAPAVGVTVKYVVRFSGDANYVASSGTASVKGS